MTPKRLQDLYAPGDKVEITFDGTRWFPAVVQAHNPPGMWVQAKTGHRWFVTNTRRVRPHQAAI